MYAAGALVYSKLPDVIPSHWNFQGQADSFQPKTYGTWLLPTLALIMAILFPFFRRIDPKSENYPKFEHVWEIIQLSIIGILAYIYAIQLYVSLNPELSEQVGRFVVFGIGVLFVVLGNYMGKIRQNFFVGMRTPWTLSDPEIWSKSQRFAGWMFVVGGLLMMAEGFLWPTKGASLFGVVLIVSLAPIAYSYMLYRKTVQPSKQDRKGMKSFLGLVLFTMLVGAAVAAAVRLTSSEDTWICDNGQWVPHGIPSAPMPTTGCP